MTATFTGLFGLIAGITAAVYVYGEMDPPTLTGSFGAATGCSSTADLIAVLRIALLMGFRFRSDVLGEAEAPEALQYFIDFSLGLAAEVVAVFGAQESPVTLDPIPAWVLALGPPLIVAAMIFTVHLRNLRETTPRWTAGLVTGVLAAFRVLPATLLLTQVLSPVLPQVDLPCSC